METTKHFCDSIKTNLEIIYKNYQENIVIGIDKKGSVYCFEERHLNGKKTLLFNSNTEKKDGGTITMSIYSDVIKKYNKFSLHKNEKGYFLFFHNSHKLIMISEKIAQRYINKEFNPIYIDVVTDKTVLEKVKSEEKLKQDTRFMNDIHEFLIDFNFERNDNSFLITDYISFIKKTSDYEINISIKNSKHLNIWVLENDDNSDTLFKISLNDYITASGQFKQDIFYKDNSIFEQINKQLGTEYFGLTNNEINLEKSVTTKLQNEAIEKILKQLSIDNVFIVKKEIKRNDFNEIILNIYGINDNKNNIKYFYEIYLNGTFYNSNTFLLSKSELEYFKVKNNIKLILDCQPIVNLNNDNDKKYPEIFLRDKNGYDIKFKEYLETHLHDLLNETLESFKDIELNILPELLIQLNKNELIRLSVNLNDLEYNLNHYKENDTIRSDNFNCTKLYRDESLKQIDNYIYNCINTIPKITDNILIDKKEIEKIKNKIEENYICQFCNNCSRLKIIDKNGLCETCFDKKENILNKIKISDLNEDNLIILSSDCFKFDYKISIQKLSNNLLDNNFLIRSYKDNVFSSFETLDINDTYTLIINRLMDCFDLSISNLKLPKIKLTRPLNYKSNWKQKVKEEKQKLINEKIKQDLAMIDFRELLLILKYLKYEDIKTITNDNRDNNNNYEFYQKYLTNFSKWYFDLNSDYLKRCNQLLLNKFNANKEKFLLTQCSNSND